ncbi:MAG: hypothetical protein ACRDK7_03435, partial [Solirubrobacteraceae bacterium]
MIEQTVGELTPLVGTRPACRALRASPATIYRRRRPAEPRPRKPRPVPARALSEAERELVLGELHSERFVDASPAQVWATLLDEGRYLASERTFYRLLAARHGGVRERRDQLTHPPYAGVCPMICVGMSEKESHVYENAGAHGAVRAGAGVSRRRGAEGARRASGEGRR